MRYDTSERQARAKGKASGLKNIDEKLVPTNRQFYNDLFEHMELDFSMVSGQYEYTEGIQTYIVHNRKAESFKAYNAVLDYYVRRFEGLLNDVSKAEEEFNAARMHLDEVKETIERENEPQKEDEDIVEEEGNINSEVIDEEGEIETHIDERLRMAQDELDAATERLANCKKVLENEPKNANTKTLLNEVRFKDSVFYKGNYPYDEREFVNKYVADKFFKDYGDVFKQSFTVESLEFLKHNSAKMNKLYGDVKFIVDSNAMDSENYNLADPDFVEDIAEFVPTGEMIVSDIAERNRVGMNNISGYEAVARLLEKSGLPMDVANDHKRLNTYVRLFDEAAKVIESGNDISPQTVVAHIDNLLTDPEQRRANENLSKITPGDFRMADYAAFKKRLGEIYESGNPHEEMDKLRSQIAYIRDVSYADSTREKRDISMSFLKPEEFRKAYGEEIPEFVRGIVNGERISIPDDRTLGRNIDDAAISLFKDLDERKRNGFSFTPDRIRVDKDGEPIKSDDAVLKAIETLGTRNLISKEELSNEIGSVGTATPAEVERVLHGRIKEHTMKKVSLMQLRTFISDNYNASDSSKKAAFTDKINNIVSAKDSQKKTLIAALGSDYYKQSVYRVDNDPELDALYMEEFRTFTAYEPEDSEFNDSDYGEYRLTFGHFVKEGGEFSKFLNRDDVTSGSILSVIDDEIAKETEKIETMVELRDNLVYSSDFKYEEVQDCFDALRGKFSDIRKKFDSVKEGRNSKDFEKFKGAVEALDKFENSANGTKDIEGVISLFKNLEDEARGYKAAKDRGTLLFNARFLEKWQIRYDLSTEFADFSKEAQEILDRMKQYDIDANKPEIQKDEDVVEDEKESENAPDAEKTEALKEEIAEAEKESAESEEAKENEELEEEIAEAERAAQANILDAAVPEAEVSTSERVSVIENSELHPSSARLVSMSKDPFDKLINQYLDPAIREVATGDKLFDYLTVDGKSVNSLIPNATIDEKRKYFMDVLAKYGTLNVKKTGENGELSSTVYNREELFKTEGIKDYTEAYNVESENFRKSLHNSQNTVEDNNEQAEELNENENSNSEESAEQTNSQEETNSAEQAESENADSEPEEMPANEEQVQSPANEEQAQTPTGEEQVQASANEEQVQSPTNEVHESEQITDEQGSEISNNGNESVRERISLSDLEDDDKKPEKKTKKVTETNPQKEKTPKELPKNLYSNHIYEFVSPHSNLRDYPEIINNGNLEELKAFRDEMKKSRDIFSEWDIGHIEGRIRGTEVLNSLEASRLTNKKAPIEPVNDGVNVMINIDQNEFQTSANGCWSVSMGMLLKSRGVDIPQSCIRSFRPGKDKEDAKKMYNSSKESMKQLNTDTESNPFEKADLVGKVLPNTGMKAKKMTVRDNDLFKNSFMTAVREAIEKDKSPVSMLLVNHFVTVVGAGKRIDKNGNNVDCIYFKNSLADSERPIEKQNPNQTYYMDVDTLAKTYSNASLDLVWLKDIEFTPRKGVKQVIDAKYDFLTYDETGKVSQDDKVLEANYSSSVELSPGLKDEMLKSEDDVTFIRSGKCGQISHSYLYSQPNSKDDPQLVYEENERIYVPGKLYDLSLVKDKTQDKGLGGMTNGK
ncbi:MAG: hypothetical protein MJ119_03335 [Lachnospiraceae bacterium]|nr:hypothetical protein [Lachnospiraceae bacterium]